MKSVFIGGVPTAGKSHLANKLAKITGATHVNLDDLRSEMLKDSSLEPWVNFFWNQDESEYWKKVITSDEHWENLKKQSEAFWPTILAKISEENKTGEKTIFEGVNILPHLVHKDLPFRGVFLLSPSEDDVLNRLKTL